MGYVSVCPKTYISPGSRNARSISYWTGESNPEQHHHAYACLLTPSTHDHAISRLSHDIIAPPHLIIVQHSAIIANRRIDISQINCPM